MSSLVERPQTLSQKASSGFLPPLGKNNLGRAATQKCAR